MLTYQDLIRVGKNEQDRMDFVKNVINQHKSTELYKTAKIADAYYKRRNVTILAFRKLICNVLGELVPDEWTANYKLPSGFFKRFVTQENQYLLGNGITWGDDSTVKKLGKNFDYIVQKAGKNALVGAVSFGFWNYDHLETFSVEEYAPLYDENNSALRAGVRFWQIDDSKPLRATLYEEDGYTDYIWKKRTDKEGSYETVDEILHDKRPYKEKIRVSQVDGETIYDGENYPSFPFVPLWGNPEKQSELVGLQEEIDCFDLILSGYANSVDDASIIYWVLTNAGGMDDVDLARFIDKVRKQHTVATEDGVSATPNTIEAPYLSREALLSTIRANLYEDAMALDTKNIESGAVTATQIKAAYENLNSKTDDYEYCVRDFLSGVLELAGIDDEPTFTRSIIVNKSEEVQNVIQAASFLPQEYVTEKLLTIFGDADRVEEILKQMEADELERYNEQMTQIAAMQSGTQGEGSQAAQNEDEEE